MTVRTSGCPKNMDPEFALYEMMKSQGNKEGSAGFCCVDPKYVPVNALVDKDHIGVWKELSYIQPGSEILIKDRFYRVTARVAISQIQNLKDEKWVHSLQVAGAVSGSVSITAEGIGDEIGLMVREEKYRSYSLISSDYRRIKDNGEGVVIGVVDFSGDFKHRHFRWPVFSEERLFFADSYEEFKYPGRTRLIALWHQQGIPVDGGAPVKPAYDYGRHYSEDEINRALHASHPHKRLHYHCKENAHGTHVMSIAAQIAPMAKLIFVDLGYLPSVSGSKSGPIGDSTRVIEAIHYIFEKAGSAPCVVNLSLGSYMGGHDGTSAVEQAIDALVEAQPNRAVVVSAANAFAEGTHVTGVITAKFPRDLEWKFPPDAYGLQRMQIWYPHDAELSLSITNETGQLLKGFQFEQPMDLLDTHNNKIGMVWHRLDEDNLQKKYRRDKYFDIWRIVDKTGFSGDKWGLNLKVKTGHDVPYHAWIERFDDHQSVFAGPSAACTLSSIATGFKSIVAGSYDATKETKPISYFSSAGPTRDGREKPDTSAPGQFVRAAKANTETGLVDMSGTSMAAPVVTGVVARMLSLAHSQGESLNHKEISDRLKKGCRKNHNGKWDSQFGWGKISGEVVYEEHLLLAPGPKASYKSATMSTATTATTTTATTTEPGRKKRSKDSHYLQTSFHKH